MSVKLENNRPVLASNQIAGRVRLADLKGWFTKNLHIGEGTCALIFDGGQSTGTVSPGEYTLQSFFGGLFTDMDKRSISAVICRTNDIPLRFTCGNIQTKEKLLANIELNLTIRFTDPSLFTLNMLGQEDSMTVEQLATVLQNILLQSIRESIAQMSITEITLPQNRNLVLAGLQRTAKESLVRYGFDIVGITFLSISNEQYNELQQKVGETFLLKEGVELDAERAKVEELKRKVEIEAQERENHLLALAAQVAGDRKDAEILEEERRIKQRQTLRETLQQAEFDKIDSEAKMKDFLAEQDKKSLLRQEEKDLLLETYRNDKQDRELVREHLIRKINLENAVEMEKLQAAIDQAQRLQSLQYEAELIRKTTENLVFAEQQELQQAEHTGRLRKIQQATEESETLHKMKLRTIEDDYAVKRRQEDTEFELWREKEKNKLRQEELNGKSQLAMGNIERMAELDKQRRQQKINATLEEKRLDNDAEKQKLLAEKAAVEKLEQERTKMDDRLSAAQDKHAETFAKSASDIKEIALVLAGSRSGQTAEQTKETVILVCPKCKTRNSGESKFCCECGEML